MEDENKDAQFLATDEQWARWRQFFGKYWQGDPHLESDIRAFRENMLFNRRKVEAEHYFDRHYSNWLNIPLEYQPFSVQKDCYERFGLKVSEPIGGNPWELDIVPDFSVHLPCDVTEDELKYKFVQDTLRQNKHLPDEEYGELVQKLKVWYWGKLEEDEKTEEEVQA